jgi:hypothetical protein
VSKPPAPLSVVPPPTSHISSLSHTGIPKIVSKSSTNNITCQVNNIASTDQTGRVRTFCIESNNINPIPDNLHCATSQLALPCSPKIYTELQNMPVCDEQNISDYLRGVITLNDFNCDNNVSKVDSSKKHNVTIPFHRM